MLIYHCLVVVLSVLLLVCLSALRPGRRNPEQMLAELRVPVDLNISEYEHGPDAGNPLPTSRTAIRQVLGMCVNASTLLNLAKALIESDEPGAAEEYRQLWGKSLLLRFCLLGCLFEGMIRMVFAELPSFYPRLAATIYGEICSTLHALVEINRPDLIDMARIVL
jgi:hypothetical protein